MRTAKRGHVQVERDHAAKRSDRGQRAVGQCASRADREETVRRSWLGERRKVAQPRRPGIGQPGAGQDPRQRRLAGQRGDGGVAGVGPLQVDAVKVFVLAQTLDGAIGDPAAA
jgi:hypothetical protein